MIGVFKEEIKKIPSLIVVEASKEKEKLPTVIYSHGFTSAKEHNLDLAYLLAERGLRVILPDSLHHGEREFDIDPVKRTLAFWEIVLQNLKDIDTIRHELKDRQILLDERIGLAGTSMGGITTSAALTQFPWIKAAAVLMGSPKPSIFARELIKSVQDQITIPNFDEMIAQLYDQLKEIDLSLKKDTLDDRPLLFWHGEKDSVVPFDHSFSFYNEVKDQYKIKEHIRYIKEKNRDHKVSRMAKLETVKWFEKYV
ncbi:alpha/beta fold hydrolase [Oceanobacillus caeni]|uniref:Esterase n=1 Tax=Oceanobacillus caeni TaxID=405946 RepID=A0ABR5MNZ5_9BACI|nr:alpha/beta fold hydrolase [Oceanobacillus caeni]KPH79169.1 esterase [Oceanobacillus caeni]